MAKATKSTSADDAGAESTEQLNALIPVSLKKRLKIAAVNQGTTVTALLIEWIEAGLAKIEK